MQNPDNADVQGGFDAVLCFSRVDGDGGNTMDAVLQREAL